VIQQHVPAEVLGRITAYQTVGAFALGPIGLAAAGPLASVFGLTAVLAFGAVFQFVSNLAVLAMPAIRQIDMTSRESLEHPNLSDPSATVIETVIEGTTETATEPANAPIAEPQPSTPSGG
jgi:hypothetical protein